MSRLLSAAAVLLCPVAFLCCCSGSDRGPGPHTFAITEEADVRIARSGGGPRYPEELFNYEKILEIRPDSTQLDSYLAYPSDIVMDREGRFYVSDQRNHRIVVFEPDGRYRRTIGQEGSGPGDLMNPSRLEIRGNTLFVGQYSLPARLTLFRTDGSFIDVVMSRRQDPGGIFGGTLPILTLAEDGSLIESLYHTDLVSDGVVTRLLLSIKSSRGDSLSSLVVGPIATAVEVAFSDLGKRFFDVCFNGFPYSVYGCDGLLATTTGLDPEVRFFDLTGNLVREARLDFPPPKVTAEDRRSLFVFLDQQYRSLATELGEQHVNTRLAKYERDHPDYKAYWCFLYTDDIGRCWLQIPEAGGRVFTTNHRYAYRVLSAEGEYLGDTTVPPIVQALGLGSEICRNLLLTLVEDPETGERIPTIYRITSAVPGLVFESSR
jgi:hypothetical protein